MAAQPSRGRRRRYPPKVRAPLAAPSARGRSGPLADTRCAARAADALFQGAAARQLVAQLRAVAG